MILGKILLFVVILQYITYNVLSENITTLNSNETNEKDGRRTHGIFLANSAARASGHLASKKVESSYSSSSSSNSASSAGVHGWVSGSQNAGAVIQQPSVQGVIQSQQGCALGSGNNLLSASDQSLILNKKTTMEGSQSFTGGSVGLQTSNQNNWQLDHKGEREEALLLGQVGEQSSSVQGSSSHVTKNNMKEVTGTIVAGNNQGGNTVYENTHNFQQESVFHPENQIYKVSLIESGDGIYANEIAAQQSHNVNVMPSSESNSHNIVAIPIMKPQYGRVQVQGYRPNMQYYLRQIEANNINNPSIIFKVPSFVEHIKPDQMNIKLSEEQLNIYKQYLIQTGLIKLKPYQLIFSDQFRPKLKTLQWMVVPLETNVEYCRQRCGNIFARNTLYSSIAENAGQLSLKLLVPVLKVRSGLQKTVTGAQTIAGGVSDISSGVYRMIKDSPSHVSDLVKEKSDESNNQS